MKYLSGFNNEHATEAVEGALPVGQNSPQKCPLGLYAEQVSGSAFTCPRGHNLRTWVYRIRPSVGHGRCAAVTATAESRWDTEFVTKGPAAAYVSTPEQLRWSPFAMPASASAADAKNFVEGIKTVAGAGDPSLRGGLAVSVYCASKSMFNEAFYNADGDMLIVPQHGKLVIKTEMGLLYAEPSEIIVIPRGIRFQVTLPDGPSRGYILETFDRHWELPDLGPIGANGLANPRDFLYPTAHYEDVDNITFTITVKYQSNFFRMQQDHSCFDVVAWHGNYAPFKYDLRRFNTVNTVSFDHPDPSIFTVLTVKSGTPGVALADFVIFPPRWMVSENTFRPPYFHRNVMTEFMGLINGSYDAKAKGFLPGGASLHSVATPHGPDVATFEKASNEVLGPHKLDAGLAFMFETSMMLYVAKWAMKTEELTASDKDAALQKDYLECWQGFAKTFKIQ